MTRRWARRNSLDLWQTVADAPAIFSSAPSTVDGEWRSSSCTRKKALADLFAASLNGVVKAAMQSHWNVLGVRCPHSHFHGTKEGFACISLRRGFDAMWDFRHARIAFGLILTKTTCSPCLPANHREGTPQIEWSAAVSRPTPMGAARAQLLAPS